MNRRRRQKDSRWKAEGRGVARFVRRCWVWLREAVAGAVGVSGEAAEG